MMPGLGLRLESGSPAQGQFCQEPLFLRPDALGWFPPAESRLSALSLPPLLRGMPVTKEPRERVTTIPLFYSCEWALQISWGHGSRITAHPQRAVALGFFIAGKKKTI